MAISLKNPEADRLARAVAGRTGETLTGAITTALRERLARLKGRRRPRSLRDDFREIGRRCAALPTLDARTDDDILGYDERGVSGEPLLYKGEDLSRTDVSRVL